MLMACVKAAAAQVSGVGQGERGGLSVKAQLADEGVMLPRRTLLVGNGCTNGKSADWACPVT